MYQKLKVCLVAVLALMLVSPVMAAPRHHYYGYYRGGGGWHNGGGWHHGPNVGNVIGGIIIGNAIGNWLFPPRPVIVEPAPGPTVEWCMQRYRSYNPQSHTYLGYDGQVHGCP